MSYLDQVCLLCFMSKLLNKFPVDRTGRHRKLKVSSSESQPDSSAAPWVKCCHIVLRTPKKRTVIQNVEKQPSYVCGQHLPPGVHETTGVCTDEQVTILWWLYKAVENPQTKSIAQKVNSGKRGIGGTNTQTAPHKLNAAKTLPGGK